MSMDQADLDMRAAVDYLAAHEGFDGTGVGSLGFCLRDGLSVWGPPPTSASTRSSLTTRRVRRNG
jgi:hypothetical protein